MYPGKPVLHRFHKGKPVSYTHQMCIRDRVKGTYAQLIALRNYFEKEGLEYGNIKQSNAAET